MSIYYDWWSYVKGMLRRYPEKCTPNERAAIDAAIESTTALDVGGDIMRMIELVYFKKTHTLSGAAMKICISYTTAVRWNRQLLRKIAENRGLME